MVQKKKGEETNPEHGDSNGHITNRTFSPDMVVLLQTRLQILEVQKEMFKKIKFSAVTIGEEKLTELEIVHNNGKIEEIKYLLKLARIKPN